MLKAVVIALVLLCVGCSSTYRTTIVENHTNKIEMYVKEYMDGRITKQQLLDLVNIYVEEMEK